MVRVLGLKEQALLRKWGCSYASRTKDPFSYVARFPCPECGADAFEMFVQVTDPSKAVARQFNLGPYELWTVRWASACGNVSGGRDEPACVATPVEENRQIVGMIEPVSPPPWYRYEKEGARGTCVAFGTRWQAEHASNADFRILAAIRRNKPETFAVSRK